MAAKRSCCNLVVPEEINEWEILTRVPVKSLIRFKSVCKSRKLLISSNSDFIRSQLDSLILMSPKFKYDTDNDDLLQVGTTIISSINGLVSFFNWHEYIEAIEIAIWNPATKRY